MESHFVPRRGTIVGDAHLSGLARGFKEGFREAFRDGFHEARMEVKAERLLRLLELRGLPLTAEARQLVCTCTHGALLDLWFDRAIDATTLDDVFGPLATTEHVPAPTTSPERTATPGRAAANPGAS
jgi:hypothetical protein